MPGDVVVVGGGIAGLSIASELLARRERLGDGRIVVLEAAPRAGGNIRSERRSGFLCEWGPTGFLDDAPATLDVCRRAGLGSRLTGASVDAERRFIVRRGRLRELPKGPLGFLVSDALSVSGRLRVLAEPLVQPRRDDADESVYAFARRRIGEEAASVLVDALITGIWAGDSRALSLRSALPKLAALERDHGGLVRGMFARRGSAARAAGPGGRLTSFPEGLSELPAAIASELGDRIRLGTRVREIERRTGGGFHVHADGATFDAGAVVLACPSSSAAGMVRGLDERLSGLIAGIHTVSVAVVHLGFEKRDASKLQGFGFLIPRGEHESLLGVLIPSNIFLGRAPAGQTLATVMIGGDRDPKAIETTDEQLIATAVHALTTLGAVTADPSFSLVIRHPRAIPQYLLGHASRLAAIDERLTTMPGLFLAGNSYRGIAINACLADAGLVADAVATAFSASERTS